LQERGVVGFSADGVQDFVESVGEALHRFDLGIVSERLPQRGSGGAT
jgi:hypothetical protein